MIASTISATGAVRQLDRAVQPDQVVREDEVSDPKKLVVLIMRILREIARLRRIFIPKRIDFEDQVAGTAGATLRLEHKFGARVRWYVVGWRSTGTAAPALKEDAATDSNVLILDSYVAGTATIRVEQAG